MVFFKVEKVARENVNLKKPSPVSKLKEILTHIAPMPDTDKLFCVHYLYQN